MTVTKDTVSLEGVLRGEGRERKCRDCSRNFSAPLMALTRVSDAQESLRLQFAEHVCKHLDSRQNAVREAITQLPRLQTFGQSNRMTEKQMEAVINLLPQPGDREFAAQKMTSLQGMIDPLRSKFLT